MPTIHAQVVLKNVSGFPQDDFVNTFTINSTNPISTNPGEVTTAIAAFYNGLAADQGDEVGRFLSSAISRAAAACEIKLYDITGHLDGSSAGPPVFEDTFTMIAATAPDMMPAEVALCLTMVSSAALTVSPEVADNLDPSGVDDPDSARDRPRQRRTGRIYLGPFTSGAGDFATGRPNLTVRENAIEALRGLDSALEARSSGPYSLRVWSRKNAATYSVTSAYADNAWDTQRRRGPDPTSRFSLSWS